jgi:hypothetical protein
MMFRNANTAEAGQFQNAIDKLLESMDSFGPEDPEYATHLAHLERLTAMKANCRRKRVSPDQMALVLGNLLGIVIIVAYEQKHVMVSKATNFVMKPA